MYFKQIQPRKIALKEMADTVARINGTNKRAVKIRKSGAHTVNSQALYIY